MLALPLFMTTLALASTGGGSWLELVAGGGFRASAVSVSSSPSGGSGGGIALGGSGGVGLTLFGHRITDDDAPPSLQPYLQYAFSLHADGGAGGFHFAPDTGSRLSSNDSINGYANVSAQGYIDRALWAYLGIGMRYRSDSPAHFTTLSLPLSLDAGIRLGDVRLSLGWSIAPTRVGDDVFKVPFWGGASGDLAFRARARRLVRLDALRVRQRR